MRSIGSLVLVAALAAACTSPKGPQSSGLEAPAGWSGLADAEAAGPLATSDAAEVEQHWWQTFKDPMLDRLIDDALANNKSLRIAAGRVEEAEAGRRGAVAVLMPEVVGTGGLSRGNQGLATLNKTVSVKEAYLQASWEADLFGKNQARAAAAAAIVQTEEGRRQAVMVSLLAEVARNYFDLRNYQEQIAITQENLRTQQRTLELIQAQRSGALSSDLDVERAAAQVSTTAAQLPVLRAAYKVALDRLNVLLGAAPGTLDRALAPGVALAPLAPTILVAVPARVLANRPDVRAAERNFAASLSESDAAAREIYPTISLVGLFGVQDSSLFSATPWLAGANLAQPLLNFGRIQSQIDAANARQTQAFFAYQEAVLEALADMEDALVLYFQETGRQHELAAAAAQDRRAVDLAEQQYTNGYSGLLDLLVAQRDALAADSSLAASNAELRKQLVHIYTAAGGGWSL
ncbi:MAG TPA: TolC family protein [Alphaproteobacteria bacterium]